MKIGMAPDSRKTHEMRGVSREDDLMILPMRFVNEPTSAGDSVRQPRLVPGRRGWIRFACPWVLFSSHSIVRQADLQMWASHRSGRWRSNYLADTE